MSRQVARSTVMSSSAPDNGRSLPRTPPFTRWSVIVPVKQTDRAKTRLALADAGDRRALALAFALDTVSAALASDVVRRVVVVTNDPDAVAFEKLGAEVVADRTDAGLNPAFMHGAAHLLADGQDGGIVGLAGDLPALDTATLDSVLRLALPPRWFVADTAGTGTTTLGTAEGELSPSFGPDSRAAHGAGGAVEIDVPGLARLRRDVDTEGDLWDAVRLGVGPHTRETLARRSLHEPPSGRLA